ncbi:DUF4352 domain-containing protein [Microtetraspora fusca]|uniref:DUF4352 domain-containing protein n=1 Tax=Microtetraspora fusca TaxID=1997 RepID=A0ABW6V0C3_MICFU
MRNGLGVAALVLSIVGALSGLIPLLFWLAGTLGLLAVIFGFVKVLVKNTGDGPAQFDGMDSGLLDADAKQYNVDSSATISQNLENGAGIYDKINPGQKVTRTLVFDLPEKTTPRVIAMFGSEGSNGAFMYLQ